MNLREALARIPRVEATLIVVATAILIAFTLARQGQVAPAPMSSYSSYDAGTGGTRALYELLGREGVRVDRFEQRPAFLDRGVDTLVYIEPLPFDPVAIQPAKIDIADLDRWVKGGGHLLYVGYDNEAAKEKIWGLPYADSPSDKASPSPAPSPAASGSAAPAHAKDASEKSVAAKPSPPPAPTPKPTPFVAAELAALDVRAIAASGDRRWRVRQTDTPLVGDAKGTVALRYKREKGTVTVVSDESVLANNGIAKADNARMLVALALPVRTNGLVAIDEVPHGHLLPLHWWQIVPRPFAFALGLAGLALVIAFAGAAVRFGPPLVPVARDDGTSADFIAALSGLLASAHASNDAALAAANSTSAAIARALGLRDDATTQEIAAAIDRDEDRAAYQRMLADAGSSPSIDASFVRAVAGAQRLRKEFASHGPRRI